MYILLQYKVSSRNFIEKTELLKLKVDVKEYDFDSGHNCLKCEYVLDEMACQTFDHLADLETSIPKDIKVSLYYIAGYVMKKVVHVKRKYLMIQLLLSRVWRFFERNRT